METFNFPYHKYSVDYPESGFKMELGGSYRYNAEPSAPDQRIFKLYFDTMLRYEAKYTKSGIIPSGNVNGDVWVDTGTQNLFQRSENMTQWCNSQSIQTNIIENATTSPSGALTADKLVEGVANQSHAFDRDQALPSTGIYTFSSRGKAAERPVMILGLQCSGQTMIRWRFNLTTGVASAIDAGGTGKMLSEANGWYRCSLTVTMNSVVAPFQRIQIEDNDSGTTNYLGNGASGIYVDARQLEKSEGMGTYLPTTTSAVSTTGINKGYRFSNGVWVPTTNPSKLNLFSNPEINLGLLEDFYLRHKMWKKFIYPHPIYGDLAVRFSRPLILPKGYTDGNGTVEPFELEFIEVPGGL